MKKNSFLLILSLLSIYCRGNYSPLPNAFCVEHDIYNGYSFTSEANDTLDYIMEMHPDGFLIFSEIRLDSSEIYFNDILVEPYWSHFNDNTSFSV